MEITFSVYHLSAEGKEFNLINAFVTCSPQSGRRDANPPELHCSGMFWNHTPPPYGMSKR